MATLIEFDDEPRLTRRSSRGGRDARPESIQLFSGFRGSGKTTELLRLKRQLEFNGYVVLYADALDYVNPAEPIEISELLIVLAAAFGRALDDELATDVEESFWSRIRSFLSGIEVQLQSGGVKAELESPFKEVLGGLKAGIDLKFELRTGTGFRAHLRRLLAARLGELRNQVHGFIEECVKQLREARGADA